MEYLRTCNTNAQAIGEFEAVAFRAFSIKRNAAKSFSAFDDKSPLEDIQAVEAELRQDHNLIVQDASRPWLWLFRATTADKATQKPLDLPVLEGYYFDVEQSGVVKANELARPPGRNVHPHTPSTASVNSPSALGGRGSQPGGARTNPSLDQPQPHDVPLIYELFTSSVIALISYHVVKDHNAVAWNYRTFVSKAALRQASHDKQDDVVQAPYSVTDISVYWTSAGSLVVSSHSAPKPALCCLDDSVAEDRQMSLLDQCVRIAPNGVLAKIISFVDPLDAAAEDASQRMQRKRFKASSAERGIEAWKSFVKRWLSWKGYDCAAMDQKTAWVKLRIAQPTKTPEPSPGTSDSLRDILWPKVLCFFYDDTASTTRATSSAQPFAHSQQDSALEWFETPTSSGFRDPIDVAQQWFKEKPDRDKALEARHKAKRAEEEAARPKEENLGLFPSSPLNARTGAYGDLQAVSGVYPTPPDGIAPGAAVSSSEHPNISGGTTNTILASGGSNPAINLSGPQDGTASDRQTNQATSPTFPPSFDQFNTSGENDDLFEEMDEDTFEGNGITDADFNFFDEPDGDDADMLDPPDIEAKARSTTPKPHNKVSKPPLPEPEFKEEASDPLAALENALAKASRLPEDKDGVIHKDDSLDMKPSTDNAIMHVTEPPSANSRLSTTKSIVKDPTPPLSPHSIQQKLLPSPKDQSLQPGGQHKDSVFDPINFNRKMSLSDAKYDGGRFSSLKEEPATAVVQRTAPGDTKKRPASLRDLPLLTKLRYAIGVAASNGIPSVEHVEQSENEDSETTSDTSSLLEEDSDDAISVGPAPPSAGLIHLGKRKLPTDGGNATPLSATSFAESMGAELQRRIGLQTDKAALSLFEPSPWDWSLLNVPSPTELTSSAPRNHVPSFSPAVTSIPGTPTSQADSTSDLPEEKPPSGKDSIAIAQIVTDQIVSATLDILGEDGVPGTTPLAQLDTGAMWRTAIKDMFPKASDCNLQMLVSLPDVYPEYAPQIKGQSRPTLRRPNEGTLVPASHINQIHAPYVRVRRGETLWDLLPPALMFWEPLGLSPCSAPKNVVAFCVHPFSDSIRPCLESFLLNVQIAFEGCRLGNHARVDTITEFEGGLVPWKVHQQSSVRGAFKSLKDTCVQLGKLLAAKHTGMQNKDEGQKIDAFVIYMVDPFETAAAVWELSSAFWSLFQVYGQSPGSRIDSVQKPDLVLQIVPMKYVASFDVPVVLESSTYINLAREVYDRCPPSAPSDDKTPLSIYTAPSFQLEESIPRAVPFKLNADPPQDLLRENSYIHIAYALSLDGTWLTAAWTDSCGKSQAVISYNIGSRVFGEIAKEIWQTTIEILSARRVMWRVCIAKAGVMERDELETWVFLASCPTQLNLFIALISVDPQPSWEFTPTISLTSKTAPNSTLPTANTPGSTPQAGVSPDNVGLTPAATPSENATDPSTDPDARLVDITDESWGVIFSHRLHSSNSTVDFRPSFISGLLVKRGSPSSTLPSSLTPDPEAGPIILGVNILWVGAVGSTRATVSPFQAAGDGVSPGGAIPSPSPSPSPGAERSSSYLMWTPTPQARLTAENLLKEVLSHYRGLGTLAKLKGMRGTREGTVPWHVAAALRGVEGLMRCVS